MGDKNGPPVWDLSPLVESEDPKDVKKAMEEKSRGSLQWCDVNSQGPNQVGCYD